MKKTTKTPTGKTTRNQFAWKRPLIIIAAAILALGILVLVARYLRELPAVQQFLADYPGTTPLPENAPIGLPAWLGWQHFLNAFFIVLIIKSGLQIRHTARPQGFWSLRKGGSKVGVQVWWHVTLDAFWLLNGLVFFVLLIVTDQWMRIVPTSWEIFPNAASAGLQYLSLDWPHENGWVNYNSLQVLAYFATVFIAAPLALLTGIRMSPMWPEKSKLSRAYPVTLARAIHYPVMLYFVAFIVMHVTLVLSTGALKNLNHMYASTDSSTSWLGFIFFAISIAVMVLAWFGTTPMIVRALASLTGKVTRT